MAAVELLNKLEKANLIHPPRFVLGSVQYLTIHGSHAYGVNELHQSDFDTYGFCIPAKEDVFVHLKGEIPGFGVQSKRFDQWEQAHIKFNDKEYDFQIYSIIRYFQLCMDNNPNMIDSLFTPIDCVLHITKIGNMVRDNRHLFLTKRSFHKMKGYAYSMLNKAKSRKFENSNRKEDVEKYGYSTKYAYHIVRLIGECEQILSEHDLDLRRNREQLKSIRRGEWTLEQLDDYFVSKERDLERVYVESSLRDRPDEDRIRNLLLECLEDYYGSIDNCIVEPDKLKMALQAISEICNKVTNA